MTFRRALSFVAIAALAGGGLAGTGSVRAAAPRPAVRAPIKGASVQSAVHAVVDFSQLAAQEARAPRPRIQTIPQPEVETPVDVPLDDELRAIIKARPLASAVLAPPPETPLPLSPVPAANFPGAPDQDLFIPPDTYGAAGPNHLMVTVNGEVRIQTKTGGLVSSVSLDTFWSSVNGGSGAFDPRVTYDWMANRWIVAACDDPELASSGFLVGASLTSDPTGSWHLFKFGPPAAGLWYDYPNVGFTKDWIILGVNLFTISGNTFSETDVVALNKTALYAGTGTGTQFRATTVGATLVPAQTYDSTLTTGYLVNNWNSAAGTLRIFTLTGPVGGETLALGNLVTSPVPWGATGPNAPQAGRPELISTNDSRMQRVIYRNGSLWATHTVFLPATTPTRASVQWWQFTTAGAVTQRGLVDDPTNAVFYAFPSIGVSVNEDVLVGYSRFSATTFASADYSFRYRGDPANTLQSDLIFKNGVGGYEKFFGGGQNRWGDYSNTVVDPVNDRDLWTIQEYAEAPVPPSPDSGRWGTWWAKLDLTPSLAINDVTLAEGNAGTTSFTFTVTLSRAVLQTVKVDFATADGSATVADSDYQAQSGTLTFNPGQTTQSITVLVNGDLKFEPNETFVVNLSNPQNANLADNQGVGTILNDDPQPSLSINDVSLLEGNSGTTPATLTVSLSNPSSQTITVNYTTADWTATAPVDYLATSGTLTFAPGVVTQPITVLVVGDTIVEPDETFQVLLSSPTNATIAKGTGVGTIVNDDVPGNGLPFFTVTSKPGTNHLEWVNPAVAPYFGTVIRYNVSTTGTSDCTPPATASAGAGGSFKVGALGGRASVDHNSLAANTTVCYAAFVQQDAGGTVFSTAVTVTGRPFAPGAVQWAMNMGIFSMIPPGNAPGVVHAVAQDGSLHAMVKGNVPEGGTWPTTPLLPAVWMPHRMSGPSQGRPSGIPVATVGSTRTIFLTSQDGHVYAFDEQTGASAWVSAALASPAALQAHPSGAFTVFGASRDFVFVGTRDSAGSKFYALKVSDGSQAWVFDGVSAGFGRIGAVSGQAAVDQTTKRVYFASRAFGATPDDKTVWCVDLETGAGLWAAPRGDIDAGVTLAGTTLFVGTNDPKVKKIDTVAPNEGLELWAFALAPAEGPSKGYVAVDRVSGDSYFATVSSVWALKADGTPKWLPTGAAALLSPSTPVAAPQDLYVYAGSGDGKLHRFFAASGTEDTAAPFPIALGDGSAAVGSPTYDLGPGYLYVGTENGIVYAIQLP